MFGVGGGREAVRGNSSFFFFLLGSSGWGQVGGQWSRLSHMLSGIEWERRKKSSVHEQRAGGPMEASRHG